MKPNFLILYRKKIQQNVQKIWLFEKFAVYLHCGIILPEFADSRIVKWRRNQ